MVRPLPAPPKARRGGPSRTHRASMPAPPNCRWSSLRSSTLPRILARQGRVVAAGRHNAKEYGCSLRSRVAPPGPAVSPFQGFVPRGCAPDPQISRPKKTAIEGGSIGVPPPRRRSRGGAPGSPEAPPPPRRRSLVAWLRACSLLTLRYMLHLSWVVVWRPRLTHVVPTWSPEENTP